MIFRMQIVMERVRRHGKGLAGEVKENDGIEKTVFHSSWQYGAQRTACLILVR